MKLDKSQIKSNKKNHNKSISLSVIVPRKPNSKLNLPLKSMQKIVTNQFLAHKNLNVEFILVEGYNPSIQRNQAVAEARGNYLYFLDNDVQIPQATFEKIIEVIAEGKYQIFGGPVVLPETEKSLWQHSIAMVFGNFLAVGKISSRYAIKGRERSCNDSELILCNLVVQKELFLAKHGFNVLLYPNEENDFINRIIRSGTVAKHLPSMFVYRLYRKNLWQFIKQMLSYGVGRARQTQINPRSFHLYLLLPFALILCFLSFSIGSFVFFFIQYNFFLIFSIGFSVFFTLYFILTFFTFIWSSFKKKRILWYYMLLFFCCHFFYTIGFFVSILGFNQLCRKKNLVRTSGKAKCIIKKLTIENNLSKKSFS